MNIFKKLRSKPLLFADEMLLMIKRLEKQRDKERLTMHRVRLAIKRRLG